MGRRRPKSVYIGEGSDRPALVSLVVGAHVGSDGVLQLVLGAAAVAGASRHDGGDASVPEDEVDDVHVALVALVDVHHHVLGTADEDALLGVVLQIRQRHSVS